MLKDFQYAYRTLRQHPGFAITAIISIAIGIGANSAIFSFQDGLLLRPLAIKDAANVVSVRSQSPTGDFGGFSYPDFQELRDKNRSFESLVAYRMIPAGIARDEKTQPQFKAGFLASGNFFDVLGIRPRLGRGFGLDEDIVPGRDRVVVLSYDFWQSEFAGDPLIVGRHIRIGRAGGLDFTIIGVAPEAFTGMDLFIRPAFYVPISMGPQLLAEGDAVLTSRSHRAIEDSFHIKARLKPGVSIQAADADIRALGKTLAELHPEADRGFGAAVRTERQVRLDGSPLLGGIVAAVSGIMVIILLIASANVMNLMLSRGRARAREIAIRTSLGASRTRLIRQLMAESFMIAVAGGTLGLLIAEAGAEFFSTLELPGDAPIKFAFQLDSRVLFFTLIVSVVSAFLFGLVPAISSVRRDLTGTLKAGGLDNRRNRFFGRNVLVAIQIAGSIVLVMASAQMYRNTGRLLKASPGFTMDHRLTVRLDPEVAGYTAGQTEQFYNTLIEQARNLPGVKSAALALALPFTSDGIAVGVIPDGYQFPAGQKSAAMGANIVDEHFFGTLRMPILAGRGFLPRDRADSPNVAVVNEAFAQRFFAGNAVGKRVRIESLGDATSEIVGVTANGKFQTPVQQPVPFIFVPVAQHPRARLSLITETSGDPVAMATPIRELIRSLDPNMPIFAVRTLENIFERSAAAQLRLFNVVFSASGVMGFFLALVGLYGVVAHQVARRTREIGVRMALGAERLDVLRMILKHAGIVAGIGVIIGLVLSLAARAALLTSLGQRTTNFDSFVLVIVPLGLLMTTLIAAAIPARRASRIDPQQALRQD
jgi:predicted permease